MNRIAGRLLAASLLVTAACARELELPQPLPDTGAISGKAVAEVPGTDQVEAVQGAYISVPGTNLHSQSDQQGAFTIGPLPPGTYKVLVELRGAAEQARQRLLEGIVVDRGATKGLGNIPLRRNAVLTGRVSISGQSRGNQGITVFVPGTDFVSATADTGSWRLSNLPEGPVSVGAYRPGFTASFTSPITAQGGLLTTAVDLVIEPESANPQPGAIKGTVKVVGRTPQGVTVTAWKGGAAQASATATTDDGGAFVLSNLGVDLYRLEARLDGYSTLVVSNLLITSGTPLTLPESLVLVAPGADNVPPPPPVDAGPADAGTDAGTDADTDAGTPDAGGISAECASDNDCASGRLCNAGRCMGCSSNADCRPGYLCQGLDCVRACSANAECPSGLVCTNGVCGACLASADCKDPGQVCLPGGACGHCRSGNDCPAGKACLANGCGACSADAECGAGRLCEQGACITGSCHDAAGCSATEACLGKQCGACTADSQCAAGRLCLAGGCQVANCRQSGECGAGQVCANNLCGACGGAAQCGSGQVCDQGVCAAGDCTSDAQCTGGQVCSNHKCSPCASSAQCGAGRVCAGQACVAGDCLSGATCAAGQVCKANHCQACSATADCAASGLVCDTGACVPGDCLARTDCTGASAGKVCKADHCSLCNSNNDCASGEVCSLAGLCKAGDCATTTDCLGAKAGMICAANTCSACTGDSDCGQGRLCLGAGQAGGARCTAASCRTNGDCPSAQACVANQCTSCGGTSDCRAGQVCAAQKCVTGSCLSEASCSAGQLCVNNTCQGCAASAECGAGRVCVGNLCAAGDCVNAASDCAAGQVCLGNHCQACAKSADCGQSGVVCDTGVCTAGNCVTRADCTVANGAVNGQVCKAHHCTTCSSTADCSSGEVCNLSGLCEPGNCATNADCTGTNAGKACLASGGGHSCQPCGTDAQCGAPASGKICGPASTCIAGNCHADSDCTAGGQRLCLSSTCTACTQGGANSGGCGSGKVCDTNGFCQVGTCAKNADCVTGGVWDGRLCTAGYSCVSCTLATSASCGAGFLCDAPSGRCVAGTCQSNADCPGVTSCVNHACAGNCRQNSDCYAQSATCNTGTHSCVACTASSQCGAPGSGLICNGGGQCVAGQCAADVTCAVAGQSCVNNACVAVAPQPGPVAPPATNGSLNYTGSQSALVTGKTNLYVNVGLLDAQSQKSTVTSAVIPDPQNAGALKTLWSVTESLNVGGSNYGQSAMVLPAPGVPGDETVVVNNGNGHWVMRAGGNGALLATLDAQNFANPNAGPYGLTSYGVAAGFASGAPQVYTYMPPGSGLNVAIRQRADGLPPQIQSATLPCGPTAGPVVGTYLVYYFCNNAILGLDPATLAVRVNDAFPGALSISSNASVAGSRLGSADYLVISSLSGQLFAGVMLDSDAQQLGHHFTWYGPVSVGFDSGPNSPIFIDQAGAVWYQGGAKVYKFDSSLVQTAQAPSTPYFPVNAGNFYALGADGTLMGYDSSTATVGLRGLAFSSSSSLASQWSLTLPAPGFLPKLYPVLIPPSVVPGGPVAFWSQPSGQGPSLGLYPSPKGVLASQAPAWTQKYGDSSNHMAILGAQCLADTDCAAPASCILGKCQGQCRSQSDCGAGQGCSAGVCGACVVDSSCNPPIGGGAGGTAVCYQSQCTACAAVAPLNTCCHTSADCGAAGVCKQGACVPIPTVAVDNAASLGQSSNAMHTTAVGTDGTVYVLDYTSFNSTTVPQVRALKSDGTPLWAQPLGTTSPVANLTVSGTWSPMVVRLPGASTDTIFYANDGNSALLAAVTAPVGQAGSPTIKLVSMPGFVYSNLTYSKAGATPILVGAGTNGAGTNLWAIDAAAAAAGTKTVLWTASSQCNETTNGATIGSSLLTGTDGTVYHLCGDGTLQAWDPKASTVAPGTGNLFWTSPAAPAWNLLYSHAAIARVGGFDTIYAAHSTSGTGTFTGLTILTIKPGGLVVRTDATGSPTPQMDIGFTSVMVDRFGNGIVINPPNLPGPIFVYSPAGQLLWNFQTSGGLGLNSGSVALTDDDQVIFMSGSPSQKLSSVQLDPVTRKPSLLWQAYGPGQSFWTGFGASYQTIVPRPGQPPAIFVDWGASSGVTARDLLVYPLVTGTGLQAGWSTWGGDNQHRYSLLP